MFDEKQMFGFCCAQPRKGLGPEKHKSMEAPRPASECRQDLNCVSAPTSAQDRGPSHADVDYDKTLRAARRQAEVPATVSGYRTTRPLVLLPPG